MKKWLLLVPCIAFSAVCKAQSFITPFEKSNGTKSATYKEMTSFYERLDEKYESIKMIEAGTADAAYPLHVVYYSKDEAFDIKQWKEDGKVIVLVNNGIHPGEPDGIDASMMLLRDAAKGDVKVPDNVVLAVIPVFNIGGMLNRGSHSRANQNGPEEYGFRGNGQNLDLNRDFIKMDAKETQSLVMLFHKLSPDIFIDNHVSNGADYQHIMTLLTTQHNKLGGVMGEYLNKVLEPMIYLEMYNDGYSLVPYVNHWGHTPDRGWTAFHEGPRFASGFAAMFHTYAFVTETHMLKPYNKRVDGTYELMRLFLKIAGTNAKDIKRTRKQAFEDDKKALQLPISWEIDTTQKSTINFKGYEAGYKPSEVSGKQRLYYDRNKPYNKTIPYFNTYVPKQSAKVPEAYIIPRGWHKAINRLRSNNVKLQALEHDTTLTVTVYYIQDYETTPRPYEGHYLHSKVKLRTEKKTIKFLKGDYVIATDQPARRFLVEVLEPNAPDSYFAWGFFDAILQQKEGYSDYVFEDEAAELLKKNHQLRQLLADKKKVDTAFANSGEAQLDFVYKQSQYYEPVHMRYPVFRVE